MLLRVQKESWPNKGKSKKQNKLTYRTFPNTRRVPIFMVEIIIIELDKAFLKQGHIRPTP